MKSKLFNLNKSDFYKGLIVAVITAFLTAFYDLIASGGSITLKNVLIPTILALLSYLIKNLFTNSQDQVLSKE